MAPRLSDRHTASSRAFELRGRVVLLQNGARQAGLTLPDDVAKHLAEHVDGDPRTLDSAVANLEFWCLMMAQAPSFEVVDRMLRELDGPRRRAPIARRPKFACLVAPRPVPNSDVPSGPDSVVDTTTGTPACCRFYGE